MPPTTPPGPVPGRIGGRPRQLDLSDIARAGRDLGLRDLSMNAVASRLGVSSTALYRHVDGRWGLERLVGESLLEQLHLHDDPAHDTHRHLVAFGLQLYTFVLAHPGLAGYLQTLFPRGPGGRRLLATEVRVLERHGYSAAAAVVLSGAVASLAIGFAAAQETQSQRSDGLDGQRQDALDGLLADEQLGAAQSSLPAVESAEYVRLILTAAIGGLLQFGPPGRPVEEIVAALQAAGEGV